MSIEIKDVTKDFKKVRALNTVNLTFEENKIYGLLGRNGAGKIYAFENYFKQDFFNRR